MTETQAAEVIELLTELNTNIELSTGWLQTIASWLAVHVSVIIPGVIVIGLMYWALHQFINRYY